jgi:hypothetical protein
MKKPPAESFFKHTCAERGPPDAAPVNAEVLSFELADL